MLHPAMLLLECRLCCCHLAACPGSANTPWYCLPWQCTNAWITQKHTATVARS